ncbi:MAG TPA: ABC transporter ATP-binding protein [Candidatus Sulfobium mesophilum]|nr:ABC transporter ATP-binding protein [Candidatus Sulfobium mesophilum]
MGDIFRIYRIFAPNLRGHCKQFVLAYLALFVAMVMNLLKPWPLKLIFDHILLNKPMPRQITFLNSIVGQDKLILLIILCLGIVGIYFLESLFTFTRKYFMANAGERTVNDIRQQVYGHLQMLESGTGRSADFVVRLTSDIDSLKLLLTQHIQTLVNYLLTFVGISVTMFLLDWELTLVALAVAPPLYLLSLYFSVKVADLTRKKRDKESEVASLVQETVASKEVVQAFAREEQEKKRFADEIAESMDASLETMKVSKGFGRIVEVIMAIGTALVVYFGVRRALEGYITPGSLIVFISYLRDLYKPVGGLSQLIIDLSSSLVCGKRIAELLETKIGVVEASDAIDAPPFRGEVVFENVTFGYDTGGPVLEDLSFKAAPGETVALIGASGTGKSTIVNLLLRFYDPWTGRILIDGKDIRGYTLKSLREQISVVLQEPLLFHRTVRENILYGKPEASPDEMTDAGKAARAHDFIMRLPDGYDTFLKEAGANLSGGQRQRIALARAILKNSPIFIFDEPVTGLDAETETKLSETLDHLMKGKTSFIIAHRFSTIIKADLILMVEEGRISEQGTHEQLLARSDRYRQLYDMQRLKPSRQSV